MFTLSFTAPQRGARCAQAGSPIRGGVRGWRGLGERVEGREGGGAGRGEVRVHAASSDVFVLVCFTVCLESFVGFLSRQDSQ